MKRLNDRQVILSRKEQRAYRLFSSLTDRGSSIEEGIEHVDDVFGPLDSAFIGYLRGEKP